MDLPGGVSTGQAGSYHDVGPASAFMVTHLTGQQSFGICHAHTPPTASALSDTRKPCTHRGLSNHDQITASVFPDFHEQRNIQHAERLFPRPTLLQKTRPFCSHQRMHDGFQTLQRVRLRPHNFSQRASIQTPFNHRSRKHFFDQRECLSPFALKPPNTRIRIENRHSGSPEQCCNRAFPGCHPARQTNNPHALAQARRQKIERRPVGLRVNAEPCPKPGPRLMDEHPQTIHRSQSARLSCQ